jgi:hypothetical protein
MVTFNPQFLPFRTWTTPLLPPHQPTPATNNSSIQLLLQLQQLQNRQQLFQIQQQQQQRQQQEETVVAGCVGDPLASFLLQANICSINHLTKLNKKITKCAIHNCGQLIISQVRTIN